MKHSEFWAKMEHALGPAYVAVWAEQHTLPELGSRTVQESLRDGETPKTVWRAVWSELGLPARER